MPSEKFADFSDGILLSHPATAINGVDCNGPIQIILVVQALQSRPDSRIRHKRFPVHEKNVGHNYPTYCPLTQSAKGRLKPNPAAHEVCPSFPIIKHKQTFVFLLRNHKRVFPC